MANNIQFTAEVITTGYVADAESSLHIGYVDSTTQAQTVGSITSEACTGETL